MRFSWTGSYVGANIGYGFGGEDEVGAHAPESVGVSVNNIAKFDDGGVFGGAQAGYNYQIGSFVVGLEADIQGSGISDQVQQDHHGGRHSLRYERQCPTSPGSARSARASAVAWDRILTAYGTARPGFRRGRLSGVG